MGFNLLQLLSLKLKLHRLWPVEASLSLFLSPFGMALVVFNCFLAVRYDKTFQGHLASFLFQTWNEPFL